MKCIIQSVMLSNMWPPRHTPTSATLCKMQYKHTAAHQVHFYQQHARTSNTCTLHTLDASNYKHRLHSPPKLLIHLCQDKHIALVGAEHPHIVVNILQTPVPLEALREILQMFLC